MPDPLAVLDAYAEHLGIPRRDPDPTLNREAWESEPLWDGHAMIRLDKPEDVAHEIAHWLLAPDRRQWVDYGWGYDYQWPGRTEDKPWDHLPFLRDDAAYENGHEEIQACVLGFAFLIRVGAGKAADTAWDDYSLRSVLWSDDGTTRLLPRIDPEAVRARREVQPHVEAFARWHHSHS